jgi:hypothetical protein
MFVARCTTLPFFLLGCWVCYIFARDLYGTRAGSFAAIAWTSDPLVVAWSSTLTTDVPAASMGMCAAYTWWRCTRSEQLLSLLLPGIVFGIALLTKFTLLVLLVVIPISTIVSCLITVRCWQGVVLSVKRVSVVLGVSLLVVNGAYEFSGTLEPLGDKQFASRMMAGDESLLDGGSGGNCFAGTAMGGLAIPLPAEFISGIDLQRLDFERGANSYLLGEWRDHGWWYYYAVAALVKTPTGLLVLFGMAMCRAFMSSAKYAAFCIVRPHLISPLVNVNNYCGTVTILFAAVAIVTLVCSQDGFSGHYRYILPAVPFLIVSVSYYVEWFWERLSIRVVAATLICWSTASSMCSAPFAISYFNEIGGGAKGGYRVLLGSNLDWGQDIYRAADWLESRPESDRVTVVLDNVYSKDLLSDEIGRRRERGKVRSEVRVVLVSDWAPGESNWVVVNVNSLRGPFSCNMSLAREYTKVVPSEFIGHTLLVYRGSGKSHLNTFAG